MSILLQNTQVNIKYALHSCNFDMTAPAARMDTTDLETLMLVIRLGSFAAAARELQVDPSSVSRSVAALESELGTRLFQRSTRRLAVTEAGAVFGQRLEPLLEELQQARQAAVDSTGRGARHAARQRLEHLWPAPHRASAARVLPAHPALEFDLMLTDSVVDLVAERIDIAVR